jgi:bifunctional non-homologous end joining protein LigD
MPTAHTDPLQRYSSKRDFKVTPEPKAVRGEPSKALSFVVQKHWASRLHYDFRLELDGVLLSWAVPKGPSFDPKEKRMAVHVEDHPVSYGGFEGTIPPKQYGAGKVIVWDRGTWEPVGDPRKGMSVGKLEFRLHGEKLAGLWELIRIKKPHDKQDPWLLFKKRDEWARPQSEYDVIAALPDSVIETPLGLVEQREPRGTAAAAPEAAPAVTAAAELPNAVAADLPARLEPQLATLAKSVPHNGAWRYELKLDGYRLLARVDDDGTVKLFTRRGNDWTGKLKPLAEAVEALQVRSAWLDGEIVVLDADGTPNFNALQNAFDSSRTASVVYFLFDLPFFDGYDLRRVPLLQRRTLLKAFLDEKGSAQIRFSADFDVDPAHLLESAAALKLEGIIAKRADAPYVSQRTETWLKVKARQRQEFVIAGFTDRTGSSREVGSLVLAY